MEKIKKLLSAFLAGLVGAVILNAGLVSVIFFQPNLLTPLAKFLPATASSTTVSANTTVVSNNDQVTAVVDKVNPAVVSIVLSKDVPNIISEKVPFSPFGNNSLFQFFQQQYRQDGTKEQEVGSGSGFIISTDGYIVTNNHVVENLADKYTVFLNDGTKYEATIVATDEMLDIALLKIEATNLSYLNFGDSDQVKLGQAVIAIGNALGEFRNTVSVGVVSGLSRSITAGDSMGQSEQLDNIFQTDAAINPGNSGGPLLNLTGEVIGINVAVASGSENIAFSIPANAVKSAIDSLKTNGKVVRPFLGVRYVPITSELANQNNLSVDYGALILRGVNITDLAVTPGSPADKAGLMENDIILEFDGQKIDEENSLRSLIAKKAVGDKVKLKVLHKGDEEEVDVTLVETP